MYADADAVSDVDTYAYAHAYASTTFLRSISRDQSGNQRKRARIKNVYIHICDAGIGVEVDDIVERVSANKKFVLLFTESGSRVRP